MTGDAVGRAVALRGLATVQWRWGRLAAADDLATEAVATARDAGAASIEALALSDAGGINGQQARYDEAQRCYSRALELSRQHGERYPEGSCLLNLGVVHERRGQLEAAADHYRRAGAIFEEVGYDQGRASALANLAEVPASVVRTPPKATTSRRSSCSRRAATALCWRRGPSTGSATSTCAKGAWMTRLTRTAAPCGCSALRGTASAKGGPSTVWRPVWWRKVTRGGP